MALATLADATDLEAWARRRDAQARLPQLVRRLVHATASGVRRAGFRSGEGVSLGGWDGVVLVEQGNEYVPVGMSGWEVSARKDIKDCADENYRKRTEDPLGADPQHSTFVFLTPRRWSQKSKWRQERLTECQWQDVQAYDADDLAGWLEMAPAVHVWLSMLLGKHPEDAFAIEDFWLDWSESTVPKISPALVLAGRSATLEKLISWLRASSPFLALRGESRDEAIAVAASVIEELESEERLQYMARTLVVRSDAGWQLLASSAAPLVLIPTFDCREVLPRALRGGHRVIIPLGRADSTSEDTVEIPRLSSEEAMKVLSASGVPDDQARVLARLARKSLMAFRRRLATRPEVQQPEWARPANARSLVPVLLAGAWSESNEADTQAISSLANQAYDRVREILLRWVNEPDAPLRRVGDSWFVVSAEDMWALLSSYVVPEDLVRLERVAIDALGEIDPRFDLPEGERWMAAWKGKVPRYSGLMRAALADTLALLGSRGENVHLSGGTSVSDYVGGIVRVLLERANGDWRLWASLSGLLRAIGEAAPTAFLSAVEVGLAGQPPLLLSLFSTRGDSLFTSSPHTGLLWALEALAWSSDHLSYVAEVLALLAEIAPDDRRMSEPVQSLSQIFLSWYPQTTATLDQRLRVIDALRVRHSEVAWRLILDLLPSPHGMSLDHPKPRFRDWQSIRPDVTLAELRKANHEIFVRVLGDGGHSGDRWKDIIHALSDLPHEDLDEALRHLDTINHDDLPSSSRLAFWNELRSLLSRHRTFPNAAWAMPRNSVDRLASLFSRFEPREPIARFAWLFTYDPELPEGRSDGREVADNVIAAARVEGLRAVHASGGPTAIVELAKNVTAPLLIGETLGTAGLFVEEHSALLTTHLASPEKSAAELARGVVIGSLELCGRGWLEAQVEALGRTLTVAQRAVLLACSPADAVTWNNVSSFGPETDRAYWLAVSPYSIREESSLGRALDKLLEYGRPISTLEVLHLRRSFVSLVTIASSFERALQTPSNESRTIADISYEVSQLLQMLAESADLETGRVAALEWSFLPLLNHHEYVPRRLHEELTRNPQFFAEVVRFVYGAVEEERLEPSEELQIRAQQGFQLLRSWRRLPGILPDGDINASDLAAWIKSAREATAALGRTDEADRLIGEVLGGSPGGTDGAWPHEAVREVIESVKSPDLEAGLEGERINSRGVVTRTLREGGSQERELVDLYRGHASLIRERWPRTAALLGRLADHYQHLGRREDEDAELREDLGT
jgi:hypothetical protein